MGCCIGKGKAHSVHGPKGAYSTEGTSNKKSISRKLWREKALKYNMAHYVHEVLDKADFEKQLKEAGGKLVMVDFYAQWCGPCKVIGPKIEELATQLTDVIFLKVDVDQNEEIASEHEISCMPTFILFQKEKKVEVFSGANIEKVKETIAKHNKTKN